MDFASDGSYVAGGFADSSVRLWNLKKSSNKKDDYTVLWGHSGPGTISTFMFTTCNRMNVVFGTSFSPDNQFLLSASEDTTGDICDV